MSYYIFLKSLRSLEEFRKNPNIKISSYKFPKPWYIQKSNLYSEKNFSFTFSPIGQPAHPAFFLLIVPAERRLFLLLRHHAMDAAP
jgi:hypothetical protein